jgi:maleate cis-trans isomerase
VFVPGGATMTLHAILQIEEEFGIPVFTNLNAEVWNGLIRPGIIDPAPDWGMLLASK